MTLAEVVLGVMFVGLIAYALFGGADFGAGIWDLLAGGTRRGAPQRAVIEHAIGPVWEANHVWLIFVLVVLWTGFPAGFTPVASTLYVPLTLAAFGMIARGAAFAFRKSITTLPMRRFLGAAFAVSSLVTPYFLGAVVGGVASGRVPQGIAKGDVVTSWVNPTSTLGGVLAVLTCAYLAAVFLCLDALRDGHPEIAEGFRLRALGTAAVTGLVGLVGLFVLRADAPQLADGLFGQALPVVALSVLAGVALDRAAGAPPLRGGARDGGARRRRDPPRLGRGPVPLRAAAGPHDRRRRGGRGHAGGDAGVVDHRLVRARARARLPLPTLPTLGKDHAVSVQKAVELIGTGTTIQDAVTEALDRARLTLDGITSFEVADITGVVDGASVEYRVELRVWFTLLERMHG